MRGALFERHALLALLLAGCGTPATTAPTAIAGEDVVATVDGRPITVSEVALQARSAGTSARQALTALVEAEVMAAEAERRGLRAAPEVQEAERQALARRFLVETFEREVTPADIPEAELRQVYDRNRGRFDHPELVETRHILAPFNKDHSDDMARRALLRARALDVAARARSTRTPEEFMALAVALSDDRIMLKAEDTTTALRHWTVPAFADAAFALPRDGAVSDVVETDFGYHVILRVHRLPEEHKSFSDALPELRTSLFADFRKREFLRFTDRLAERHVIARHPEGLEDKP